MIVDHEKGFKNLPVGDDGRQKVRKRWVLPQEGTTKLNMDGAFVNGEAAGASMVLRTHNGDVIFSACRNLQNCVDATDAELQAMEEGIKLSLLWTELEFNVETDYADALELIKKGKPNMSI